MSGAGGATPVLILAGSARAAADYARRFDLGPHVPILAVEQLLGRVGCTLIVLENSYTQRPRWYEFLPRARAEGMHIVRRYDSEKPW